MDNNEPKTTTLHGVKVVETILGDGPYHYDFYLSDDPDSSCGLDFWSELSKDVLLRFCYIIQVFVTSSRNYGAENARYRMRKALGIEEMHDGTSIH